MEMSILNPNQILQIAQMLSDAFNSQTTISALCEQFPGLSLADAYQIQEQLLDLHIKQGRVPVGYKMGLTNKSKMQEHGLVHPLHGYIFSSLVLEDNPVIPMTQLIQPRVECEVAFVLAKDLSGPNITIADVISATDYILPALEIVDSRYHDFEFAFNDGIADNICGAMVVLGKQRIKVDSIDLTDINVILEINNKVVAEGNSSVVLDNPANSVAMLANKLAVEGKVLKAGSIIMSGMIAGAIAINTSDKINANFAGLGAVTASVSHHEPYMW